jgi:hypothetical protein
LLLLEVELRVELRMHQRIRLLLQQRRRLHFWTELLLLFDARISPNSSLKEQGKIPPSPHTEKAPPKKEKNKKVGGKDKRREQYFWCSRSKECNRAASPQRSSPPPPPPPPRSASRALLLLACDASLTPWVTVARLLQSCPSAERQPRKIFYTENRSLPFPTPQSLALFSSDDCLYYCNVCRWPQLRTGLPN